MTHVTIDNEGLALAASVTGTPSDPAVLFLHGITMARDAWDEIAHRLADRFHVWTVDFRGHGHSARATDYRVSGYVSDASRVLDAIGRPAVVVGHSLGGVVAGVLAQRGDPRLHAALLVDPPWYFGVAEEYQRTVFPSRFALLFGLLEKLRAEHAPLETYVTYVGNMPHPAGGVLRDHVGYRHLLSHASALQRLDLACWPHDTAAMFDGVDPSHPFRAPITVIRADERFGAALLPHQSERMRAINPDVEELYYEGAEHIMHRSHRFAGRFAADVERFVQRWAR